MIKRFGTVALAWGVICTTASSTLGQSGDDVVAGVIARYEAVYSGRFEYHRRAGFANTGRILSADTTSEFKFFDTDWLVRSGDPPLIKLNHGGGHLDIRYQRQSEGKILPSVWIHPPSELDAGIEVPRFAGTLWYPETVAFLDQHRTKSRHVKRYEVDGAQVDVVEWLVSPRDTSAFAVITPQLREGGILRLSVAKDRGFVLPLVEYVAPGGRVAIDFHSSEWREVGPNLFWPWRCERRMFTQEGDVGFFVEYRFGAVERVNEPLAGDEFVIDLPKGTYVNDVRPGADGAVYIVGESIVRPPVALPEGLDLKAPIIDRSWRAAAVIGGTIAIALLLLVCAVIRRHRKSA
jgi:hypothetical protein